MLGAKVDIEQLHVGICGYSQIKNFFCVHVVLTHSPSVMRWTRHVPTFCLNWPKILERIHFCNKLIFSQFLKNQLKNPTASKIGIAKRFKIRPAPIPAHEIRRTPNPKIRMIERKIS